METPTGPSSSVSLVMAQEAVQRGERDLARQICVKLVHDDPANEQAWLGLADTAESLEEKITALNHVLELNSKSIAARAALYEAMQHLLRKDAFLAYRGETDVLYQVRTALDYQFTHPKDRVAPEPFPSPESPQTRVAFRRLGWAVIGLIPAGVGTLFCAPLAALTAIKLLNQDLPLTDRRQAWVVLWSALALWLIAVMFAYILLLHLM